MIRRPPRSTHCISSAASDVYKRQYQRRVHGIISAYSQKTIGYLKSTNHIQESQHQFQASAINTNSNNDNNINNNNIINNNVNETLKNSMSNIKSNNNNFSPLFGQITELIENQNVQD
eukprot:TRINITY_DN5339_c0_g1_i3.p2 TRINITY_DN5339_c0_g1~~TRINITY_DN5339_c0_g1_i3.p2  ORF type:complete len:118 (+),score=35.15 TRINITY_DN5339_c0_g1_i3:165-518(+)